MPNPFVTRAQLARRLNTTIANLRTLEESGVIEASPGGKFDPVDSAMKITTASMHVAFAADLRAAGNAGVANGITSQLHWLEGISERAGLEGEAKARVDLEVVVVGRLIASAASVAAERAVKAIEAEYGL